jgi:two-component system response regulator YesN
MHTILIIDPDAEQYYQTLAASVQDCRIIVQNNKEKACSFFLGHDVDLVLLDHTSDNPCKDLLEVVRSTAPSVPAIIMTAEGSEELAVNVFKCGARDYLKKPFTVHALQQSIYAALGGKGRADRVPFNPLSKGIQNAIGYITANYSLPLNLARVAHEAGMSVSSFERTFKKTLGITFSMYLNKVRIGRAIQMLEQDGRFSISEIAYACGFKDHSYFTKMFKRFTKTSPREFKRALVINNI